MLKIIVYIIFILPFVMGFLGMIGICLSYFFPPKEEKIDKIIIEIKREDVEDD